GRRWPNHSGPHRPMDKKARIGHVPHDRPVVSDASRTWHARRTTAQREVTTLVALGQPRHCAHPESRYRLLHLPFAYRARTQIGRVVHHASLAVLCTISDSFASFADSPWVRNARVSGSDSSPAGGSVSECGSWNWRPKRVFRCCAIFPTGYL